MAILNELKVIATADVKQLEKGMEDAKKSLASTAIAANKLDSTLKTGAKGTQSAAFALQNLGRVAQDAPFGFIGIQNNLNPLLESFTRLKAETGSASGALKAMGSSLVGVGGLGFALSIVSSAIVIFQNGILGFNKKAKEAETAADDLGKAIKGIFADSAKEATNITSLIAVIENQNESYKRRNDALAELQRIQPQYFSGLKIEGDTINGLDAAYKNYLANFKNVIAAKVLQAKLDKEITTLLELQGTTLTGFNGKYKNLIDTQNKAGEAGQKLFEIQQKIKSVAETKIGKQEGLIESIFNQLKEVSSSIKVPEIKTPSVKINPDKIEITKPAKDEVRLDFGKAILFVEEAQVVPKLQKKGGIITTILAQIEKDKELLRQKLADINGIIQNSLVDAFVGIGENIGKGLAGGGFGDLFKGIFTSLATGLKELGKYLIKMYTVLDFIKKIQLTPAMGILAGISLVALGSLIQNRIAKTKAFATGTTNSPAGAFLVGERGPELITLPKGSGVKTNGQLNAMNNAGGFVAETILRGKDIAIVVRRANETFNRNN